MRVQRNVFVQTTCLYIKLVCTNKIGFVHVWMLYKHVFVHIHAYKGLCFFCTMDVFLYKHVYKELCLVSKGNITLQLEKESHFTECRQGNRALRAKHCFVCDYYDFFSDNIHSVYHVMDTQGRVLQTGLCQTCASASRRMPWMRVHKLGTGHMCNKDDIVPKLWVRRF